MVNHVPEDFLVTNFPVIHVKTKISMKGSHVLPLLAWVQRVHPHLLSSRQWGVTQRSDNGIS